ncbi:MAG: methylated-DNA--[protein]-cysteine S-methyltransferase [Bryobacteraceae bacterium]|nr:methylated-DNA--[protein]-cysteine S-methyltransferase [Bryobacteraceae bacterium]
MTNESRWLAIEQRQRNAGFVYGVATTGIYCRPSCPAKRPKPENIRFYDDAQQAEKAGFRACKRCGPAKVEPRTGLVSDLCRFLEANSDRRVSLEELSQFAGLSPFHLQRTFRAELGVSPREYQSALRQRETDPGDAVTYGFFESPMGRGLIAETRQGVCAVSFGVDDKALLMWLRGQLPYALLQEGEVREAAKGVLQAMESGSCDLPLDIRGTVFQQKVWNALRAIPPGQTNTYEELAASAGRPRAVRAAATACANNRIAILIPCHRIVRKDGALGGYRWGLERKRELLQREDGLRETPSR